ncbi:MAG TPA: lasso peptide biosynthesis B2 protein [Gemmatimonadales bacterium]
MSPRLPLRWRLRATAAVMIVPPLVYLVSFARLATWLGRGHARRPDDSLDDVSLARWVDRLLRHLPGPWHRTCLKRAAVLYHLLRRAGRPVELWIGVHKPGPAPFGAHAWLVRAGVPYLESHPEHAMRHTVIARFPEVDGAAA